MIEDIRGTMREKFNYLWQSLLIPHILGNERCGFCDYIEDYYRGESKCDSCTRFASDQEYEDHLSEAIQQMEIHPFSIEGKYK